MLGIDPNFDLMPAEMRPKIGDKEDIQEKLWIFCKSLIDQTHDLICGIKPQSAYFEQYGSVGVKVLAKVIAHAKNYGLLVLMDAKRGDIGATSTAYSKSYLSPSQYGSDLESDALTVNPFLGLDTLDPFAQSTLEGKGVFVLVKTSNPGSGYIQNVQSNGLTVSQKLADWIQTEGQKSLGQTGYSNIGSVVGATKVEDALELRIRMPSSIFLAPGIGAQGGDINAIKSLMDSNGLGVVVPISRAINYPSCLDGESWSEAVRRVTQEYCNLLVAR
jgi:orotidine-5'-phosphate decarboxylase